MRRFAQYTPYVALTIVAGAEMGPGAELWNRAPRRILVDGSGRQSDNAAARLFRRQQLKTRNRRRMGLVRRRAHGEDRVLAEAEQKITDFVKAPPLAFQSLRLQLFRMILQKDACKTCRWQLFFPPCSEIKPTHPEGATTKFVAREGVARQGQQG